MKTAMAILCSIVLLTAQMLMAQPSACCPKQPVPAGCCSCCSPGHEMSCCVAQPASHSQPVPANETRAGAPNDFSLLALALLTSAAPVAEVRPQFSPALLTSAANGAPLYERHCARLI